MNTIIIISVLFVFLGCVSESKPQRGAHGAIIREDQFAADNEYKRRAEEVRMNNSLGVFVLAERCDETNIPVGSGKYFPLRSSCEVDNFVRLKLQCEVPQGAGVPYYQPMRFKEFQVNLVNIEGAALKDPKRLPSKMVTSQDGIVDFSFTTKDSLTRFQIEITNQKGTVIVDRVRIADPIMLPEYFCQK